MLDDVAGALVIPHYSIVQSFARFTIESDNSLPLISNTYGTHILTCKFVSLGYFFQAYHYIGVDGFRIMFIPPWVK